MHVVMLTSAHWIGNRLTHEDAHLRGDARVEPAGVDGVPQELGRLDHVDDVVDDGPNLAADLDLLRAAAVKVWALVTITPASK